MREMILEYIIDFQEFELVSVRIMLNFYVYYLLLYGIMIFYMIDFIVIDLCNVYECIINFLYVVFVSMCLLCVIREIIYCVNGYLLIF